MSVALIMPTYNQLQYLPEAVASVEGQADQFIIVDDASTDGTNEWLGERYSNASFGLGETHSALLVNRGTAGAINAGMDHVNADTDWVGWVSSDNVYAPDFVATLLAATTRRTGAVYAAYHYGMGGKVNGKRYEPQALIKNVNCYFGPVFLIRKRIWQLAGSHRGKISHDYDHWLRVEEACWALQMGLQFVDQPLCQYRVHDQRVTETRRDQFDARIWQQEAMRRRRQYKLVPGA